MRIEFQTKDRGPANLVAEVELFFGEKGLWVTFPSRHYEQRGERKFFDYLRSADTGTEGKRAMYRLKDLIVDEWCKRSGEAPPRRPGEDDEPF